MRRAHALATIAAVVAPGVAVAVALSDEAPRRAGSNFARVVAPAVTVPPTEHFCMPRQLVPGDTGAIDVSATTHGGTGPSLRLEVTAEGRDVARGRIAAGYPDGGVRIHLAQPIRDTTTGARVCLFNTGRVPITLNGESSPADLGGEVNGVPQTVRIRLDYVRPGRESWWEIAPAVLHRATLGRADLGGGAIVVLAALLLLGAWLGAAWLVARGERP